MKNSSNNIASIRMLGFDINPGTIRAYLEYIKNSISKQHPITIYYHNLHTLHEYLKSPPLRQWYQGTTVLLDGMPLVLLLRSGGHQVNRAQRVTYVDLIWPLLEQCEQEGWRVFVVGQPPDVLQLALGKIRKRYPNLSIAGHDGYFDTNHDVDSSDTVINQINEFGTDLCLVGLGTPKQEKWVYENRTRIHASATLLSGACMEYVAGIAKTPPRWMGRCGLEWSYRFFENPKRFVYRYFIEPWSLIYLLTKNALTNR